MSGPLYNRIQLYAENSAIKFPVDDTAQTSIPSDVLLDMSIVVPATLGVPHITNLVIRGRTAFLSVEALSGSVWTPVCHAVVRNPEPWRMYQMESVSGISGWVVFGPGVRKQLEVIGEPAALDSRVLRRPVEASSFTQLEVNGVRYAMPSILSIRLNNYLEASLEERAVSTGVGPGSSSSSSEEYEEVVALVLKRNDAVVTDGVRRYSLVSSVASPESALYTINNVPPDGEGVFTITLSSNGTGVVAAAEALQQNTTVGAVLLTSCKDGCPDAEEQLDQPIRNGKKGHGVPYDLPLDEFVADTRGRTQCSSTTTP
jgi:hypothetical protein